MKIIAPAQQQVPAVPKQSYLMKKKKKGSANSSYKYVVCKTRSGKPVAVDAPPFGQNARDLLHWMTDVYCQVGEEAQFVLGKMVEGLEKWIDI